MRILIGLLVLALLGVAVVLFATRPVALPAIWQEGSKAGEIGGMMRDAAVELAAVASDGQEALGPAVGAVGKQCGACHEDYRQSDD